MKKTLLTLLLALVLCTTALAAPDADRAGNPIAIECPIEKIACLSPTLSREIIALGLADRLVAVDPYTAMYDPDTTGDLPQYDMMTPEVETLAALEPDVVIIAGMSTVDGDDPFKRLQDLGIPVVVVPAAESLDAVCDDITFLGELLGQEDRAAEVIEDYRAQLHAVAAIGDTIKDKKTVAIEISALPYLYCAGGGTYMDEMIALIGAVNAYADCAPWASVTEEAAVAADPDVIVTTVDYIEDPAGEILSRAGWSEMKAIKNGDVYALDPQYINQPNQELVLGLWALARAVYPEAYAQP